MKSLYVNISSFWALWILHPNFAAWASLQVWQMLIKKKEEISVMLFLFTLAVGQLPERQCCSVPPQGSCTCTRAHSVRTPACHLAETSSSLRQRNNTSVNNPSQFQQRHLPLSRWCINVLGNGWMFWQRLEIKPGKSLACDISASELK